MGQLFPMRETLRSSPRSPLETPRVALLTPRSPLTCGPGILPGNRDPDDTGHTLWPDRHPGRWAGGWCVQVHPGGHPGL